MTFFLMNLFQMPPRRKKTQKSAKSYPPPDDIDTPSMFSKIIEMC